MVLREFLSPMDLFKAQALYIHKTTKVVIVYKDKHFMLVAFQIVTLYFEDFDNSQKLAIMDLVSSLCRNYFS